MQTKLTTRLSCAALLVSCVALTAYGQITPNFYRFTPTVIRSTETQPVLLEASISGAPTRVALDFAPAGSQALVDLLDNGANGDRRAGDGIYSVSLTAARVVQGLRADDVFRRDLGFLRIFQGTTLNSSVNLSAAIHTPDLPTVAVARLAPDLQCTDYVVNIVAPAFFNATQSGVNLNVVSQRFYQTFRDEYDMLNLATAGFYVQNRIHVGVKNDVQGIGQTINDRTAGTGSTGRLLGFNLFPNIAFFDGANTGYIHEIGHQWIQFMQVAPFTSGIPHWPFSSMAAGVMGFSIPGSGAGGNYNCRITTEAGGVRLTPDNTPKMFTDLDLYLMGLLPADQVGENIVFNNQSDPAISQCNGLYTGAVTRVRAAEVIAAFGPRVPSFANSPKQFRLATIVVSPDALLNEDAMAYFDFYARRAAATEELPVHEGLGKGLAKPFAVATGGRGTLVVNLGAPKAAPLAATTATSYSSEMLAPESIASAFGANLATSTVAASTIPLPTELAGTTLKVKDANGLERFAPLFFVSPQQVNFLIPAGLAFGNATLSLITGGGIASVGATRLTAIAPGLFAANANGQGVAAAFALRVKSDGTQSYESILRFDQAAGRFVSVPINLGPAGDQVFLILYGSGMRGVSGLSAVTCVMGGQAAPVLFAGAQGELVGLDQVNVSLPRSLVGRGDINLTLTVDGKVTNTVQVNIE